MIVFLDTEFTDLVVQPRLLSVALVAEGAHHPEFYAEVTDPARFDAASWFALDVVLPQFGLVDLAGCTYAALGLRLSAFLGRLVAEAGPGEAVEIAFGYHLDWELVERAVEDAGAPHWASTRRRIHPVNVHDITGFDAGKLAAEAYFKTQAQAAFSRHHALCDARALRVAYEAATADQRGAMLPASPERMISTRRFIWRPPALSLPATGNNSP